MVAQGWCRGGGGLVLPSAGLARVSVFVPRECHCMSPSHAPGVSASVLVSSAHKESPWCPASAVPFLTVSTSPASQVSLSSKHPRAECF